VDDQSAIANIQVKNAHIPSYINIGCIYRDPEVIIVNGETVILPYDRLVILSTPDKQQQAIDFIQRKADFNETNHN
jgi:trk system potassium uptake protein TrkA